MRRIAVMGIFGACLPALVCLGTARAMPASTAFNSAPYSGGYEQLYGVPAGVRLVLVEAIGESGGGPQGFAGRATSLRAVLPSRPGTGLYTIVLGEGWPSGNGGGGGGSYGGGEGGAASAVRVCSMRAPDGSFREADDCGRGTREPFLLVAAGGGGAGAGSDAPSVCGVDPAAGDAGASLDSTVPNRFGTVLPGLPGRSVSPSQPAGAGGLEAGLGGKAARCAAAGGAYGASEDGEPGMRFFGGAAGDFFAGMKGTPVPPRYGGGGGGGGYFGGGGGSSGQEREECSSWVVLMTQTCEPTVAAGGGGGGSSFVSSKGVLLGASLAPLGTPPRITYTPLVSISRPLPGARIRQGRKLPPVFECALDRCRAPRRLDTRKPGTRTFTLSGYIEGRRVAARVRYRVVGR